MVAVKACRTFVTSKIEVAEKDTLLKAGMRSLEQLIHLVDSHLDHNYMLPSVNLFADLLQLLR